MFWDHIDFHAYFSENWALVFQLMFLTLSKVNSLLQPKQRHLKISATVFFELLWTEAFHFPITIWIDP